MFLQVNSPTPARQNNYLSGYQYINTVLEFFATSEGYVKNTVVHDENNYNYVFNYTDHLGNIRLSYGFDPNTETLKVLEENNYYPYGLKHENYNTSKASYQRMEHNDSISLEPPCSGCPDTYKYKYNGKEWQDELGLNMYDMDMRDYDPAIGRWVNIDPVVHYSQSTYNGYDSNPVFWADPSGASSTSPNWNGDSITWSGDNLMDGLNMVMTALEESGEDDEDAHSGHGLDENEVGPYNEAAAGGGDSEGGQEKPKKKAADPQSPEEQAKYRQDIVNMSNMYFDLEGLNAVLQLFVWRGGTRSRTPMTVKSTPQIRKTGQSTTNTKDLEITHGITKSSTAMVKLKADIKINGVNKSIKYVEYNGKKYVVDGHHRLRAARELGIKVVPTERVSLPYAGHKTPADLFH